MSKTFFGFALADSMFNGNALVQRTCLSIAEVEAAVQQGVESCCNPSHAATIAAMGARYGLNVAIPATPPRVSLGYGDAIIVMGVRGLPRLTDRHEYSETEVAAATFEFSKYEVVG